MNATLLISGATDAIRGLAAPIVKMPLDSTSGVQSVELLLPDDLGNDPLVAHSFNVVKAAMQADSSYAWSWHCNIAMAMFDEGVPHETANRGAVRFMQMAFDVDTSASEEFKSLETQWKEEPVMTTPTQEQTQAPKVKNALCCAMHHLPVSYQNSPILAVTDIPESFWSIETKLVDRALCETDETLRQFIPYIVLRNPVDNTYFTYSRGQGSAEARLRGNLSVGLGGHMDELVPEGHTLATWCLAEARRELEEEAGITTLLDFGFEGLLCDPTNPVGRVHLGLLAVVDVNPEIIETLEADVIENGEWLTLAQLNGNDRMEHWSKAAVSYLLHKAATA